MAGELMITPFSRSMVKKKNLPALKTPCTSCGTALHGMKKCAGCKLVYYCSKFCQQNHWTVHKEQCHLASRNADTVESLRRQNSKFKRLMTSQFSHCLAFAQGQHGVFVLTLRRPVPSEIVFQFHTPAELAVKKGVDWEHLREVLRHIDFSRTVVGAMAGLNGDLIAITNVSA